MIFLTLTLGVRCCVTRALCVDVREEVLRELRDLRGIEGRGGMRDDEGGEEEEERGDACGSLSLIHI